MERLSLVLVGDLMLGRCVNEALTKNGLRHVWGNFQPLLSGGLGKNQIVAGNLECASKHLSFYPLFQPPPPPSV